MLGGNTDIDLMVTKFICVQVKGGGVKKKKGGGVFWIDNWWSHRYRIEGDQVHLCVSEGRKGLEVPAMN